MCSGAFGQFQNFRHNAQMGFGLVPENSLTAKRVKFEADLENYVAPGMEHGDDRLLKERKQKEEAKAAASEAAAISEAEQQKAKAAKASTDLDAAFKDGVSSNGAYEEARAKSLLASASEDQKSKLTETKTTKATLLGG